MLLNAVHMSELKDLERYKFLNKYETGSTHSNVTKLAREFSFETSVFTILKINLLYSFKKSFTSNVIKVFSFNLI